MLSLRNRILDDLTNEEYTLELIPSWTLEDIVDVIWLHSEKGESLNFSDTENEYQILKDAIPTGLIKKRVSERTGKPYKISALARLWELGVIRVYDRIDNEEIELTRDTRFIWQDAYFRAFSSSEHSVSQMNKRLQNSTVCIVGAGAAGSLTALMLTAAGVGKLRLVDGDTVASSNLPRQILYPENSIGRLKIEVLRNLLLSHHSHLEVETLNTFVDSQERANEITTGVDFLILTADQPRLKIREWIGKASLSLHVPYLAMGGNWIGPISVPYYSPCYLCQARTYRSRYSDPISFLEKVVKEPLPDRAAFGPRPALVASFVASTTLHYLSGTGTERSLFESFKVSLDGNTERLAYRRYRNCAACATHPHAKLS
ncbi:hypothetical protein HKK55_13120 [Pseudomonas sp. ADAK18]|uniref:HesA/MoeB/ThiF family protein n=1 Tax=Pseudomonas sp. ADAK18 TaxID=2730848 RepID=UPI0014633575|nr:ThiF family adenylyltransferase [Pseudomonas sp. ADAK18]QJI29621.1 hypothetical protein HKK55_13120 [Pseudomonas sp. ADAK18]